MEITQLTYFKTVAKHESFTKAAMELHITQSALSRSIAQLESEIGILLFERKKGGKLTLNSEGKFFLQHVTQLLNELEHTVAALKEMTGLDRGVVNVALTGEVYLKHIIRSFTLEHPEVRLNCRIQSEAQIKASMEAGTLNFAVSDHQIFGQDLIWTPLCRDRLAVLMPSRHALAHRREITASQLKEERFIVSDGGYTSDNAALRLCQQVGFAPHVVYQGADTALCEQLISDGLGIMIVPYSIRLDRPEITNTFLLPLSDEFAQNELGLLQKKNQFQSAAAQELLQRIQNHFSDLT